jgi:hypothetical protein
VNLLKLSRKYQCLEEQWKLLYREYHSKDTDIADKDVATMYRIQKLQEWKSNAIQQLKLLFEKLREAVPMKEFDIAQKEVQLSKQRVKDFIMRNAKLATDNANLHAKMRMNMQAEVDLRNVQESKEQLLEEYDILRRRLEFYDPVFKFENQIFNSMAKVIQRARVSLEQAFVEFD